MADQSLQRFGKYRLLERLGMGGMAETWRAELLAGGGVRKSVVIKRILPHKVEEPGFVEMFIQEARLSAGLSHGNLAQVFDFGEVAGEYFIAMELVDGLPLNALMRAAESRGYWHLPYPIAMLIAIDACKGLHHAHTRVDGHGQPLGIVHRDISPDNLVVSFEGETKVLDFGVAKAKLEGRSETDPGIVKGKYLYFSPEQAVADPLDARSDVYALGIVLYQMLCGARPYGGATAAAMVAIADGRYVSPMVPNPDLPHPLAKLLERALAHDREARTPSAQALQEELSAILVRFSPRASSQWVKGFVSWVSGGSAGVVGDFLEQWKPEPRTAPVKVEASQMATVALGSVEGNAAPEPPPAGSRSWWLAMGAIALVGAGAATLVALPRQARVEPAPAPVVSLMPPEPIPIAPTSLPATPEPPAPAPPLPALPRTGVPYEADAAPVAFTVDWHHLIALDDMQPLRADAKLVAVVGWPKTTSANKPVSLSRTVRLPTPSEDISREVSVWLAEEQPDKSVRLRSVPAELRPARRAWIFAAVAHTEWPGTQVGTDFYTAGPEGVSPPLGLKVTTVRAPHRFTVHSLAASKAWTLQITEKPGATGRRLPLLMYARAAAETGPVALDGKNLVRDSAVLAPGKYELRNADWLWVSFVGLDGQDVVPVEVTLSATRPSAAAPRLKRPPPPSTTLSCGLISMLGSPRQQDGWWIQNAAHGSTLFLLALRATGAHPHMRFEDQLESIRECQKRNEKVTVRAWRPWQNKAENDLDLWYFVETKDLR